MKKLENYKTGHGEDCTTGWLGYDYTKNHYKLTAFDLSRQKELDADPKAIKQIEFAEQLKNVDSMNADGRQSMFIWRTLEKTKKRD